MRNEQTVGRLLLPVVLLCIATLVSCGAVAVLSLSIATRSIAQLSDQIRPAAMANEQVLIDHLDAETGIRGWGLTGEESALAPYNRATQRLPSDLRVLEEFASDQPRLAGPAAELSAASRAWIEEYAEVRLDRPAGQSGYDPRLFAGGQQRFERIRSAHDGLRVAFEEIIADARAEFRAR
ncbi:CHASE3 domain-containing protein, partial [Nocardioides sp.]|uniref:CHASE3 domain-containing protein n=1 Tax=Nocardioides sp. TaxID=35761 RepID=UPI0027374F30